MAESKLIADIDSKYEEGKSSSEILTGVDALRNFILNLFKTSSRLGDSFGERPYEPTYGCLLEKYLFEPMGVSTALDIKDTLYDSITSFLPEFYVTRNSIIVNPLEDVDAYRVYIAFVYQGDPADIDLLISRKVK